MKRLIVLFLAILLTPFSFNVISAVSIVECEDAQGNRSFQKTCPPGSTQLSTKKINTGSSNSAKKEANNVNVKATLYLIPDCEACEEIKEFLGSRNISIAEKNVNENIELQTELTDLTGSLKVPTTVIGDEVLTGYSRSKFIAALEAAGYKETD